MSYFSSILRDSRLRIGSGGQGAGGASTQPAVDGARPEESVSRPGSRRIAAPTRPGRRAVPPGDRTTGLEDQYGPRAHPASEDSPIGREPEPSPSTDEALWDGPHEPLPEPSVRSSAQGMASDSGVRDQVFIALDPFEPGSPTEGAGLGRNGSMPHQGTGGGVEKSVVSKDSPSTGRTLWLSQDETGVGLETSVSDAHPPPAAHSPSDSLQVTEETGSVSSGITPRRVDRGGPLNVSAPGMPSLSMPAQIPAPERTPISAPELPRREPMPAQPQVRIGQVTVVVEGPNPKPARTRPVAPDGPGDRQLRRGL